MSFTPISTRLRCEIDCEQSLFFFRFSESNARARERRSRETRETRAAASPVSRHQSRAWPLRVSRFARRTTEKKETARSLAVKRQHEQRIFTKTRSLCEHFRQGITCHVTFQLLQKQF